MQSIAARFLPQLTAAGRRAPLLSRSCPHPFPRSLPSIPASGGSSPLRSPRMATLMGGAALCLFSLDPKTAHPLPGAASKQDRMPGVSRQWIATEIERLGESVANHPVLSHPLFDLLEELAQPGSGYTPAQIDLITANYFRACLEVIPAIVDCINLSVKRGDAFALAKLAENLNEEAGGGHPEEGHRALALLSLNAIRKLHDCHPLDISGTYESPVLLPAVKEFIAALKQLNQSLSDHESLGAEYADERVSLPMMTLYFKTLVEPFKSRFGPQEWASIRKYWDLHIGGTEERHAKDLLESLKEACQSRQDVEKAHRGAAAFLELQGKMLDAVYLAAKQAGKVGRVVPIPSEPLSPSQLKSSPDPATRRQEAGRAPEAEARGKQANRH